MLSAHVSKTIFYSLILIAGSLAGCYDPASPEKVFVAGPDASVSISISASDVKTSVGSPVVLYASRRTSGYLAVPFKEVPSDVRWWRSRPPAFEEEVAGNLRWVVEPEGKARFNTDFRKDFTREVRFMEPGTYWIYGLSTGPGPEPVASSVIKIEVVE